MKMSLKLSVVASVTCLLITSVLCQPAAAEMDVVLDARPGAVLIQHSGTFKAIGTVETQAGTITEIEKISGMSINPNVRLGVGWDNRASYVDLTATAGVLVNDPFRTFSLGADSAWVYKYRKNVAVGPHIGLRAFLDPSWSGDAVLEFSDSWGAEFGVQVTLGYDILFVFSVDYLYTNPFDVKSADDNWEVSDSELDLSGVTLQFGMRGRF